MDKPIIKIESLSHRYATAWAIQDINIDIRKRGIYGLLGSNGAGKSTTMNILCGVINQTKGEVYINGIDIRRNPIEAKKQIGFLPQTAPLYMDLTVNEYLVYCSQMRRVEDEHIVKAVEEVLEKCGIVHVRNRLLKNLSGGYRQRVGIAQAIVHKPAVVVLDEPTNGLDPLQIIEVRNLIKDIAKERTVIFSSHILGDIQLLSQEIIMIEQGKLVFSDTMDAFNNYIAPRSIFLEFENPPAAELLRMVDGVSRIEQITPKSFRLFYDGSRGVSEKIITRSVAEGWRLIQLSIEKSSVDDIFKQITKNASNN